MLSEAGEPRESKFLMTQNVPSLEAVVTAMPVSTTDISCPNLDSILAGMVTAQDLEAYANQHDLIWTAEGVGCHERS
jgi:hypothetical protein